MTATNHLLSGAVIGLVIDQPAAAIIVALASHFVLDALPHFGLKDWAERAKNKNLFTAVVIIDGILASLALAIFLLVGAPWIVFAAAIAAALPDVWWIYRFVVREKLGKLPPPPHNWFEDFHKKIQRYESKNGLLVEIVFFVCLIGVAGVLL